MATEYDGDRGRFVRDRRRLDALVAAGWTVLQLTAADLGDAADLVARVAALLARHSAVVAVR